MLRSSLLTDIADTGVGVSVSVESNSTELPSQRSFAKTLLSTSSQRRDGALPYEGVLLSGRRWGVMMEMKDCVITSIATMSLGFPQHASGRFLEPSESLLLGTIGKNRNHVIAAHARARLPA